MLAKSPLALLKQGPAPQQAEPQAAEWNAEVQAHFGPLYDRLNSPEKVEGWQPYRRVSDK